jgi:alkyl hydroperoxide reductase subunit AhpC
MIAASTVTPRRASMTTLALGDTAPDFTAETTEGTIRFHEWLGNSWAMLFSHPKDFTPVCTTELGVVAKLKPEFEKYNCKVIGLSVDSVEDHRRWANDIKDATGYAPNFPLIGDRDLKVAKLYGMLPASVQGESGARTAADNATVRSVFLIGPDKKIKLMITYPMSTGRDFAEILRVLASCQLTAAHKVATPADWKPGDEVIIAPSLSNDDAKQMFPGGWKSPKPYIRYVPQPRAK